MLTQTCLAGTFSIVDDMKPRVINLDFPDIPTGSGRAAKLAENGLYKSCSDEASSFTTSTDALLSSFLDMLPSTKNTVIYTTSPVTLQHHHLVDETELYEMDPTFASPAHMELKRDFSVNKRNTFDGNITLPDGPLFERYQFFGPGTLYPALFWLDD